MILGMNTRTVVMVGVALIAAAGTALFARGWLNAQRAALGGNQGSGLEILVAKVDVPPGHFVKPQDLRWQAWPKGTLAPAYIVKGKRKPEEFDGAVAKSRLVAGQPVTDALVVRPGEHGFLAAVLEPGKRAVSIQVNAITGISGFVFPGDRVDMVMTHTVRNEDGKTSSNVSETVLEDIRVLAVDQKTDDQKGKAAIAKTVTFEVTPKQVEKIGIITKIGKISLSLRPVAREPVPEKSGAQAGDTAASTPAAPVPAKQPGPKVNTATPGRSASLSPIGSAQAAEAPADGAQADGAPGALIHPEVGGEPASGQEAEGEGGEGGEEATESTEETAVAEAPPGEYVPPRERAGITLDSEVSRVIGRNRPNSGRKVSIVRGAKIEERKF